MNYIKFTQLRKKLGGRSRTSIYRDVECGELPRPVVLGGANLWIESEVDDALLALRQTA